MGMNTFRALLVIAFLALLAGCAREAPPPSASATAPGTRSVVITMDMDLRVSDVTNAAAKVRAETERAGGYVEHGTMTGEGDDRTATYDLRVPKRELSAVRARVEGLGQVESEHENVDDVTDKHADLDARLRNARAQESRLLELMAQKTGSISDLLETEKELARVRENVEKLDAEKRTLDGQIEMTTLHVAIAHTSAASWDTPGKSIAHAWSLGVHGAKAFFVTVAMVLAATSPTVLPIVAFLALVVLVARRLRARRLQGI
jgi:predicted small lipoprotein YifL